MSNFTVTVTGGDPIPPNIVKCRGSVSHELRKRLNTLDSRTPHLLYAQVGSGKTYAITHELLPWAIENNLEILYVSSRLANNTQAKHEIIKETGEEDLLAEHTPLGLRRQKKFKGITVITFHALYLMMLNEPNELRSYDVLVFDEIHALFEDADFVPYTGYVLYHLKDFFCDKIRLYMSGTPEAILPHLVKMETPYQLTVLKFPKNFSYVEPCFFHEPTDVINLINLDRSSRKWLLYVPSIKEGAALASQLSCSVCLLNSETRAESEDEWGKLLERKSFSEKVAIVTSVVDVGVSFDDRALSNVVTFTSSLTTLVQVLGRKRLKGKESVHLFVWCPDKKDLLEQRHHNLQLLDQLSLFETSRVAFMEKHILRPNKSDLRRFVRTGFSGELYINALAKAKLTYEVRFFNSLLKKGTPDSCCVRFAKAVAHYLLLCNLDYSSCWLNASPTRESRCMLDNLIADAVGNCMTESEFSEFADNFRDLWVATYGTGRGGKDRNDRHWKEDKISKKFVELGGQYQLRVDQINKSYTVLDAFSVEEVADE